MYLHPSELLEWNISLTLDFSHPSIFEAALLVECRFPMLEDLQIPWDMVRWRTYYHLVFYIWRGRKWKRTICSHLLGDMWFLQIPEIDEYM